MEDVLEVYQRPYDPDYPVVCFDETRKELHGSPRPSLPAQAGLPERVDYEYERNGSASLLLWYEPLAGPCGVSVREQHTGVDIANVLRRLSDEVYPDAKKIVLVCDNLSTHKVHFLYDKFTPEEARRLSERFEWHYTPEHGSWLNIAECALSVLSRQCLNRRIADLDTLRCEVTAWEQERNRCPHTVTWQFRAEDARIKLKRLYPIQSDKTS
jgi:transposase